jgi:hypothetical protein
MNCKLQEGSRLEATTEGSEASPTMTLQWTSTQDDRGIFTVILENDLLRLTVLPELGGKLWSIVYKPKEREMLWHHPQLKPQPVSPGAPYDDLFCGGWDELFPSDAPVTIDGFTLPDHGEWWSIPWSWRVDETPETLTLTLEARGFATPHRARRTISLRQGSATITLGTWIHNIGDRPIPYLWRHHPSFPVAPGARIDLPPVRVMVDAELTPHIADASFIWPHARAVSGETTDLSHLPAADSGQTWMLYATELPVGWCAVTYPEEGIGIGLAFEAALIDTITLFATFGGWRDLATILPEPGVGYPADLIQARVAGRLGRLDSGEVVEYALTVMIDQGRDSGRRATSLP